MKPTNGKAESSVKLTSKSISISAGAEQQAPTTVAEVMGEFTEEAIKKVSDTPTRERLSACHDFCSGVAEVFLAPEDDKKAQHLKEQLGEVLISLGSVQKLVSSAVQLMNEVHDRDAKADAYHVAVAHVQENHGILGERIDSYSLLVRGKLGKKHPDLSRFGIRIPKGGRPTKKASSASTSPGAAASNAPASPVK